MGHIGGGAARPVSEGANLGGENLHGKLHVNMGTGDIFKSSEITVVVLMKLSN